MKEQYKIVDTNIFLIDPIEAIYGFSPKTKDTKNYLVISGPVLEEMDRFKGELFTERGQNARIFSSELKKIIQNNKQSIREPIKLADNYHLLVCLESDPVSFSKTGFSNDDYILGTANALAKRHSFKSVELVTNDNLMFVKASAIGLYSSDWKAARAVSKIEDSYKGWRVVRASKSVYSNLNNGYIDVAKSKLDNLENLMPNEYILFVDENLPSDYKVPAFNSEYVNSLDFALGRYVKSVPLMENGGIVHVKSRCSVKSSVLGISARNYQQAFALDALLNPEIKLVNLIGRAGTGKTMISLAAGISMLNIKNLKDTYLYNRVLATRIMVSSAGEELGILPGDIQEKTNPYMMPIYDNLKPIMFENFLNSLTSSVRERKTIKKSLNKEIENMPNVVKANAFKDHLLEDERLVIQPLSVIRGRSIDNSFFLMTEAQNVSPAEVKTFITRAAENTKVVVEGDRDQIDRKGLTTLINGLMHSSERFKDQEISATVHLDIGERSYLATLASKVL